MSGGTTPDSTTRRTVVAVTPDGVTVTLGPVAKEDSLAALVIRARSLGWTVTEPAARHMSAADFTAWAASPDAAGRLRAQVAAAPPASNGNGGGLR